MSFVHFFLIRRYYYLPKSMAKKVRKIMVAGIRGYQRYLSPLKHTKCPYIPSCSEYAVQAIEKYGAVKGTAMATWRILRCNPFSHGGYDPVK